VGAAEFGDVPIEHVEPAHVNAALDRCKRDGKSRQSAQHLLNAIRQTSALVREGAVPTNPASDERVMMPRFAATVSKERAVLDDAEFEAYLRWEHPIPGHRLSTFQRQIMALVSRTFRGLRTGDLHSLAWTSFDLSGRGRPGVHGRGRGRG
jgi:site-specific recombinase XerC